MIAYFEEVMTDVMNCMEALKEKDFYALVDDCENCLKNGGKIVASGLGKNVPICEKFVGTMNSLGMDARFLHTNTAVHGDLGMVGKKDIVLLLSKSGNTVESVALAEHLNQRGSKTWLLTFNEVCKLSEMLETGIFLKLAKEGDPWDIVPNNSTTIYLILLQGLALNLADRMGITLADFKVNHPGGGIGAKLRGEAV